jgi:dTDP-glucose 4,6-dehydratase
MNNLKKFYKGKRVLVTGADGFMGSHLTERLLDYGALVSIYVHNKELKNLNHIKNKLNQILVGNIEDEKTIQLIVKNNPQIIFHLAADDYIRNSIENPLKVIKTNINGTFNILESAKLLKSNLERLVFTSSCVIYGTNLDPVKETDLFKPNTPYAASKASADCLCYSYYSTYKLPVAIIRPFNTYGPRKMKDVIPLFICCALKNHDIELEGGGRATRDFNYITDIIDGFSIMGSHEKAIGEAVNFGTGKDISIKELAEKIIKYSNSKSKIINKQERPGQDLKSCCDNRKAKSLFGWKPKISIDEGLRLTIKWYKENAKL